MRSSSSSSSSSKIRRHGRRRRRRSSSNTPPPRPDSLPLLQIANHMRLRHPHIIALHEVFLTRSHLVLAMEYAAGGDLFRYVSSRRGLPEDEARWFFQQLMVAVDYCHRMVSAYLAARLAGCPARLAAAYTPLHCAQRRSSLHLRAACIPACLQGVTSRDIKLENTLLDGGQWPLIKVRWRRWWPGCPWPD